MFAPGGVLAGYSRYESCVRNALSETDLACGGSSCGARSRCHVANRAVAYDGTAGADPHVWRHLDPIQPAPGLTHKADRKGRCEERERDLQRSRSSCGERRKGH
eukprot:3931733-Rhodomonas_salina.4